MFVSLLSGHVGLIDVIFSPFNPPLSARPLIPVLCGCHGDTPICILTSEHCHYSLHPHQISKKEIS